MFVDSDDLLPPEALVCLMSALDETGSDFATGYVWRLRRSGLQPSAWLAPVFEQRRLRTHVTAFRPLIADRLAVNKLWRRSFWDHNQFRFPERVLHEDIPVTVPAQFLARSVDVVSEPVYYWRARSGADRSITQRRTEVNTIRDRFAAIESTREFLRSYPVPEALTWYDESLLIDDLAPYPRLLHRADDHYRRFFLDAANAWLDDADPSILDSLPPEPRREWQLVRKRRLGELVALGAVAEKAVLGRRRRLLRHVSKMVPAPMRRRVPAGIRHRLLGSN